MEADLGMAKRRDPDALPPSNAFELLMYWVHDLLGALAAGNSIFALKAGLLTGEKREARRTRIMLLNTRSSDPQFAVLYQELCYVCL